MRIKAIVVAVLFAACFTPTGEGSDGGFPSMHHVVGSVDGGSNVRCRTLELYDVEVCAELPPPTCANQTCGVGEECCQTLGRCMPFASPDCPTLPTRWPYEPNPRACGSTSDCGPDEFCMVDDQTRCLGAGHCQPITNCGFCGGDPTRCLTCGCNGVTYASVQHACVAGVNVAVSARGACGVETEPGFVDSIACGNDSQCPAGAACCALTGRCFNAAEPWRCVPQTDGGLLDCTTHEECNRPPQGGGSGSTNTGLCLRDGCSGVGKCSRRGTTQDCGGEVQPVCGCDGVTYVNACWARAAGVNVGDAGACP